MFFSLYPLLLYMILISFLFFYLCFNLNIRISTQTSRLCNRKSISEHILIFINESLRYNIHFQTEGTYAFEYFYIFSGETSRRNFTNKKYVFLHNINHRLIPFPSTLPPCFRPFTYLILLYHIVIKNISYY